MIFRPSIQENCLKQHYRVFPVFKLATLTCLYFLFVLQAFYSGQIKYNLLHVNTKCNLLQKQNVFYSQHMAG